MKYYKITAFFLLFIFKYNISYAQIEPLLIEKSTDEKVYKLNHRIEQKSKFYKTIIKTYNIKTGQYENICKVYNLENELKNDFTGFLDFTISNTGKYIVTDKLYDLNSLNQIQFKNKEGEIINSLYNPKFSQTDKYLIIGNPFEERTIFDISTQKIYENIKLERYTLIDPFFLNDKFIICNYKQGYYDNIIENYKHTFDVFDVNKNKLAYKINGDFLYLSKDEKLLITTSNVYNSLNGEVILNSTISDLSNNLKFGFKGSKVWDLSNIDGDLNYYDLGESYKINYITNDRVIANYQGLEKHTFDLNQIRVYIEFKDSIQNEISKITPKDEFETQDTYNIRFKKSKNEIILKYEDISLEKNRKLERKIRDSYEQITLKIESIGQYIPEREEFPITIFDNTLSIKIPLTEAKNFKENFLLSTITASKQLDLAGKNFEVFNIKIKNPISGSIYLFGEQRNPHYIEENTTKSIDSGIPNLTMNAKLVEPSGNQLLDGNENSFIELTVENKGNGTANNIKLNMNANLDFGIKYDKTYKITGLASGQKEIIKLKIETDRNLKNGTILFDINAIESNGFSPPPIRLSVNSQEFKSPNLIYIESSIKETMGNSNNMIENNEIIEISALIQNKGQGISEQTQVSFIINDPNIISITPDKIIQKIGNLNPGETKIIKFSFTINNEYTGLNILPIDIIITEKFNAYGGKYPIGLELKKISFATKNIEINGEYNKDKLISEASLSSDIDKNIPENKALKPNRYALIIGNENYTKYQTGLNSESNVDFATNDALTFAKYAEKTLGVPRENISIIIDAIGSKMKAEIEKICKIAEYSNGTAEIIFYYAGHGFPDEITKEGYLIPVDITGANVKEGIMLTTLYQQLTKNPVNKVTVFLDACFSGGGRNAGLLAARGIKIKPKTDVINGNLVVFTASSGEQTSLPYLEKNHGMFTYFLLKKIQETSGNVNYKTLADYIKNQVQLNSIKINSKDQNPDILYNQTIEGKWESWDFK